MELSISGALRVSLWVYCMTLGKSSSLHASFPNYKNRNSFTHSTNKHLSSVDYIAGVMLDKPQNGYSPSSKWILKA